MHAIERLCFGLAQLAHSQVAVGTGKSGGARCQVYKSVLHVSPTYGGFQSYMSVLHVIAGDTFD